MSRALPVVLSVAGLDPSAGAGIIADMKTASAMRCYGVAVATAMTAQNTQGVRSVHPIPPDVIARQIEAVVSDLEVRAVKVGMLGTAAAVETVAGLAEELDLHHLVLDPVLRSGSGTPLLEHGGLDPMRRLLVPRAAVVTPNLDEAGMLTGKTVRDISGMKEAARELHQMGARQVVVTGGHLPGRAVDVLFDGEEFALFDASRIGAPQAHGLGCAFSTALACGLARGFTVVQAIDDAKRFVGRSLGAFLRPGRGSVVLDHGAR